MAKVYKNMSTILEKVKSGKIDSGIKTNKFSGIKYFKKNEIIEPYLHIIDTEVLSRNMWHFVQYQMEHNKVFKDIFNRINSKLVKKENDASAAISMDRLGKEMRNVYQDFPKEIVYDIFNQFNTNSYKLKYKDRTQNNKNRFKFIDKANDSVLKIITNNSNIKSLVFTENVMQYYLALLVDLKLDDPEAYDDLMNNLSKTNSNDADSDDKDKGDDDQSQQASSKSDDKSDDKSDQDDDSQSDNSNDKLNQNVSDDSDDSKQETDVNNQSKGQAGKDSNGQKQITPDEMLNKMLTGDKENQKLFDDVVNQAKESIDFIENVMSEEEIKKHWDSKNAQKFNSVELRKVQNILKTIELNSDSLKPYIKKIVDKSFSYFDSKTTEVYDEFLNNPEVSEILGFEFFHPKFKNLMIEDIQIKDSKKVGKVNVYLDVSGSMSSSANIKDTPMDKLTFSKALLLKLKKMDVINEVYTFNTTIKTLKDPDLSTMLTIDTSGGTSLNLVISDIIKKDKPSIVITDADDRIDHYSEKAFLLGVAGASFHHISRHALDQYRTNNQLIVFNGDDVKKVNERGYTIN